ncbi:hypothetical protein C0V97_17825, partial [Asaia sp. W19]
ETPDKAVTYPVIVDTAERSEALHTKTVSVLPPCQTSRQIAQGQAGSDESIVLGAEAFDGVETALGPGRDHTLMAFAEICTRQTPNQTN